MYQWRSVDRHYIYKIEVPLHSRHFLNELWEKSYKILKEELVVALTRSTLMVSIELRRTFKNKKQNKKIVEPLGKTATSLNSRYGGPLDRHNLAYACQHLVGSSLKLKKIKNSRGGCKEQPVI